MPQFALVHAEVLSFLRTQPDSSFDALLCDPPYGLRFMGKTWDYDVPTVELWAECLRVLKPGAPLLSFGGSRTYHRIAVAIEDAGFEIRDSLCWLYGKGFPKSQNVSKALDKSVGAERPVIGTQTLTGNAAVSLKDKGGTYGIQVGTVAPKVVNVTGPATDAAKQWDGYGTALKPGWEPILLARKPLIGTMVENIAAHGTGPVNINGCRLGTSDNLVRTDTGPKFTGTTYNGGKSSAAQPCTHGSTDGRWPANVVLSHTETCIPIGVEDGPGFSRNRQTNGAHPFGNSSGSAFTSEPVPDTVDVFQCADDCPIRLLDESVAKTKSAPYRANVADGAVLPMRAAECFAAYQRPFARGYSDAGGPSRFFYSAKVSTKERERGCEALTPKSAGEMPEREDDTDGLQSPRAGAGRTGGARNHHPTLKPLALCSWLATLIKPPTPDAVLLVPFAGAGSEMIGALQAGWPCVLGIEVTEGYIPIALARIAAWVPSAARIS